MANPYNNPNAVSAGGLKTYSKADAKAGLINPYDIWGAEMRQQALDEQKRKQEEDKKRFEQDQVKNKQQADRALEEAKRRSEKPVEDSFLQKAGNFAKSVGESIAAPFIRTGQGGAEVIYEATGGAARDRQALEVRQQEDLKLIRSLGEKIRSAKTPEEKERYKNALKKVTSISDQQDAEENKRQTEIIERTDPIKGAAAVGEVGLNVLTGGTVGATAKGLQAAKTGLTLAKTGKAAELAQKVITPATVKQAVGSGVAQGAAYGALGTAREKGAEATAEDYATSAGIGAAAGGAIGGIIAKLSPVAKSMFDKAANEAKRRLGRELTEDEAINLAEKTNNIIPDKAPDIAIQPEVVREISTQSKSMGSAELEDTLLTAAKNQAEQRLGRELNPQELNNLTQQTKKVVTEKIGAQPVEIPTEPLKPAGDTVSGNAARIEQVALEKKLTDKMGDLPQYKSINMKEQAKEAADLITTNKQHAIDIIEGRANPPGNLKAQSVHQALEDLAVREGDADLLTKLAKSNINTELSESAQNLRIAAERDPHSAVEQIRQIRETRVKTAEKRSKTTVSTEAKNIRKKVDAATPKATKQDWNSFVKELTCR